jgi:uncharacterized protein (DUF4415 family)
MAISKERLKAIEAIKDSDIDYSDIPELDADFWEKATLRMPEPKKGVYIRIDTDVVDWLKAQGKGYQTRINSILRAYYEAHKEQPRKN